MRIRLVRTSTSSEYHGIPVSYPCILGVRYHSAGTTNVKVRCCHRLVSRDPIFDDHFRLVLQIKYNQVVYAMREGIIIVEHISPP